MKRILTLVSCMIIVLATQTLHAQEPGWTFSLGAGMGGETVYIGSDDYYMELTHFSGRLISFRKN